MTSGEVNEMVVMIKNNKYIQSLFLPNSLLNREDLEIIIQALQNLSSLQYVDFSTNEVDHELASCVALLTKSSEFKELRISKLTVNQIGFEHLKNSLDKIKGLKLLNITDSTFTKQDAIKLKTVISSNSEIQEVSLSNCEIDVDPLLSIILSKSNLKELVLSSCLRQPFESYNIFKEMRYLVGLRLDENTATGDAVTVIMKCSHDQEQ